jgi:hypothetical protein
MSGGRATVHVRKGDLNRQAGDICSVSPEGHFFTDTYFIECKHYKNLMIPQFLVLNKGLLAKFWTVTCKQARLHGREPLLVARQNRFPTLIVMQQCPTRMPKNVVIACNGAMVAKFEEVFKNA